MYYCFTKVSSLFFTYQLIDLPPPSPLLKQEGEIFKGALCGTPSCFRRGLVETTVLVMNRAFITLLISVCFLTAPAQVRPRLVQIWANESALQQPANQLQQAQDGTIWMATDDGLVRYKNGAFRVFHGVSSGQSDDYLWMTITPAGQPWLFGGKHKPLAYFDTVREQLVVLPDTAPIVRDVILKYGCESLFADQTGRIWIGTQRGGAVRYDPRSGQFEHLLDESVSITGMAEDRDGRIWFVTHKHGLRVYDPRSGQWRAYPVGVSVGNRAPDEQLPTEPVNRMFVRRNGRIMLGLQDRFVEFDPVTERCRTWRLHTHVKTTRYLASHFQEDSVGNLYFDAGNVIYQLAANGMLTQLLTDAPLLTVAALLLDQGGFLWTATVNPNRVNRYDVRNLQSVPMPVLLDVTVNGKDLGVNSRAYQLNWPRPGVPTISLPEGENLSMHFAPEALRQSYRYRYRLAGLETTWTHQTTQSSVIDHTLPAGNYRLELEMFSDQEMDWFAPAKTLLIEVRPLFWKTLWFRLMAGLVGLGLLAWAMWAWQRRQRLKRQLEKQATEARFQRQLNTFKTELFANVTHEFRTPLTVILNHTERLANHSPDALVQHSTGQITQNAHQLLQLVEELMDVARSDAGKLTRNEVVGHPALVITERVESMRGLAEEKNIDLRWVAPDDTQPLYRFDADKLDKITHNLLSNALKFTANRGRVTVQLALDAESYTLTVRDSGIGMTPDEQARIFERFYQVGSPVAHVGTGLGLAYVHELVQFLGGQITVESKPEQGSVFRVRLPLTIVDEQPAFPTTDNKPLLLLVEDNSELRQFLASELTPDYALLLAADGQQALDLALEHVPDLIVSDVMMPVMDGFSLLKTLKTDERTSHIPVILLTARASLDSRLKGLETGADDYLSKPFSVAELRYRIRNALQIRLNWQQHWHQSAPAATPDHAPLPTPLPTREEQFVARLRQLILDHLTDEIDTQWLMEQTRLSRTQLHRKLTALTGLSVTHFVNGVRLDKARELLEAGSGNASEVAYLVGFKSASYFSKLFKEQYGETPGQVKV